jgi:hypothetical protein
VRSGAADIKSWSPLMRSGDRAANIASNAGPMNSNRKPESLKSASQPKET